MSRFGSWKIIHLDLTAGLPALSAEPDARGMYAVFWEGNIPLGQTKILAGELPMTSSQLARRAADAAVPALGHYLLKQNTGESPQGQSPNRAYLPVEYALGGLQGEFPSSEEKPSAAPVSVVVCTRDRPAPLRRCLDSLRNLSQHPKEILVVDNAPNTKATRQVVDEMPEIRYVLEPQPGLDRARNAGIHHSTEDIIAFADDDVTVHPDWILRLQQGFCSPKVMAVTGLVFPAELETQAQHIFETHWSFNRGFCAKTFGAAFFEQVQQCTASVGEIGAGANMAFRRRAFELLGGFDERLDAGAAGCSGDSEMWYRILAEGWQCRYEPTAVSYHRHRRSLENLNAQIYNYARGQSAALLVQFEKYGHWGNLRRLFITLPAYFVRLFMRRLVGGSNSRNCTLAREISGFLAGIWFYLLNRQAGKDTSSPGLAPPNDVCATLTAK